jgi:hypothetical protein
MELKNRWIPLLVCMIFLSGCCTTNYLRLANDSKVDFHISSDHSGDSVSIPVGRKRNLAHAEGLVFFYDGSSSNAYWISVFDEKAIHRKRGRCLFGQALVYPMIIDKAGEVFFYSKEGERIPAGVKRQSAPE